MVLLPHEVHSSRLWNPQDLSYSTLERSFCHCRVTVRAFDDGTYDSVKPHIKGQGGGIREKRRLVGHESESRIFGSRISIDGHQTFHSRVRAQAAECSIDLATPRDPCRKQLD